jgi:hypothetical protein
VVHVRRHGEQVVISHAGPDGPAEVAWHQVTAPGSPRVDDGHYPPTPPGALNRAPKPRIAAEAQFLAIGDGAALWLAEVAAAGSSRVRAKMARAVQLAAFHGNAAVDQALGQAAGGSQTVTWPRSSPTRPSPQPAPARQAGNPHGFPAEGGLCSSSQNGPGGKLNAARHFLVQSVGGEERVVGEGDPAGAE